MLKKLNNPLSWIGFCLPLLFIGYLILIFPINNLRVDGPCTKEIIKGSFPSKIDDNFIVGGHVFLDKTLVCYIVYDSEDVFDDKLSSFHLYEKIGDKYLEYSYSVSTGRTEVIRFFGLDTLTKLNYD